MTSFDDLLEYIETETGFATSHYDDSYLDRRITARMRRTQHEEYGDYQSLLETDEEERAELLDALSVNVTSFFRDERVWGTVQDLLVDLAEEQRHVDVWSAACADGREPYSLAMTALDAGISPRSISVLATDIDENALDRARRGRYASTQTTSIEDELSFLDDPEQYVREEEGEFVVRDDVKSLVSFERHDLITDASKSGFDLVFCRNVCIYIDTQYRRPILEAVTESLRDGGYLVLGQTETLPTDVKRQFESVDSRLRIYKRDT